MDNYENKLMAFGAFAILMMAVLFVSIIKATEGRITAAECERLCGAGNVAKYDTKVCGCRAPGKAEAP